MNFITQNAEFIRGSHQMKPCIMIAKSHIFSCKMRESRPFINVFRNKLINWLLAGKKHLKEELFHPKCITFWRDFYNSVGGERYAHIHQFNLDLGQPLPPLFCFSFVYVFFYVLHVCISFVCICSSICFLL